MRKFMSVILFICLVFSMCSVVFATDVVSVQAPYLNDASRLEEIKQLKLRIKEEGYIGKYDSVNENSRIAYPIIREAYLDVPLYRQEEVYYCGPASGKMVLDYLLPEPVTQDSVANAMQTDSAGTIVWKLVNGLNSYLGNAPYRYVLTSEIPFEVGVKRSINSGYPIVCHVMTGPLPNYNYARNTGHYIVTTGYFFADGGPSGIGDEETVYYNDPHYADPYYGAYSCSTNTMTAAINSNAGYYIMKG